MTSCLLPYKYPHVTTYIGHFLALSNTCRTMSTSSSSDHRHNKKKHHRHHRQSSPDDSPNITEMLLTLGQTAHLNICTISDQVACLVSLIQPTEDGEDVQSLVNAASHEQSLAPTTECKQSLATPNEHEQSLANPSGPTPKQRLIHQAIPQRREEPQHQPVAPTPINARESVTLPNVKGLDLLQI